MSNQTGKALTKQTLAILWQDKKLFIFSTINTLIVLAALIGALIPLTEIEAAAWKYGGVVSLKTFCIFFGILLLFFIIANITSLLCSAALIACSIKKLKGQPYTLLDGFSVMFYQFFRLYRWQLFDNFFGTAIRCIAYWSDNWKNSRLATTLLCNQSWSVAITLLIPVLMIEKIAPYPAIKRSAELMQKTWGAENKPLIPCTHPGTKIILLRILTLLPVLVGFLSGNEVALVIGSVVSGLSFVTISVVSSATQVFLVAALYLFSTDVNISVFYDSTLLKKAFRL